jgi:hypothetical protein
MEDVLRHVHPFKSVYLLNRGSQKANGNSNAVRMELMTKRKVDEEINPES